jgi:hypothetical protein
MFVRLIAVFWHVYRTNVRGDSGTEKQKLVRIFFRSFKKKYERKLVEPSVRSSVLPTSHCDIRRPLTGMLLLRRVKSSKSDPTGSVQVSSKFERHLG